MISNPNTRSVAAYAEHFRLERIANRVEKTGERAVGRPLTGRATGRPHLPQVVEVRLNRSRQLLVCRYHRPNSCT